MSAPFEHDERVRWLERNSTRQRCYATIVELEPGYRWAIIRVTGERVQRRVPVADLQKLSLLEQMAWAARDDAGEAR